MSKRKAKTSAVYKYFDEEDKTFRCTLKTDEDEPCPYPILAKSQTGGMTGNLKRHLKRHHEKISDLILEAEADEASSSKARVGDQSLLGGRFGWTSSKKSTVTVTVTESQFATSILKQVVYNGVALTHFTDDGFQSICGQMAKELGVAVGREAVRKRVIGRFLKEKEALKEELKGKFVYLKFDGATRLRKHFLGISVQFLNESGEIAGKTLALVDTKAKFDAKSTKALIVNVLNDFGIDIKQVLACAVDNASVMTRTLELMEEHAVAAANRDDEGEDDDEDDDHDDEEDNDDDDDDGFLMVLDLVATDMGVKHMRCSEHSLQLAVRDGLKQPHAETFLAKIREVAANLRHPSRDEVLKRKARKPMIMDMPTRWGSTYLMVKRLVELKSHVKDFAHKDVNLRDAQWKEVENLETLLAIPYKATVALQSEKLTPGDCFLQWMQVENELEGIGGLIAVEMVASLRRRRMALLKNELFLGSVWIDSRTRLFLSEAEQLQAKMFLTAFFKRLQDQKETEPEQGNLFNYLLVPG
jgi:hypothetical protein